MITKNALSSTFLLPLRQKSPQRPGGRFATPCAEQEFMPRELASKILRRSLATTAHRGAECSRCGRTPLVGELMHVLESERMVCQLCVKRLRARDGEPVRQERIHAGRPLAVARAA
jgi:hypothetical protein